MLQSVGKVNSYKIDDRSNFDEIKQNFFQILPEELLFKIFSCLNLAVLGTVCGVSKEWKRLASDPILWKIAIYKEIAIGNDKWAQFFGTDVVKNEDNGEEFASLPLDDFIADCKKFKRIFPNTNVKHILMLVRLPKTLNGGLTLKSIGELAKKYLSNSDNGYSSIHPYMLNKLGDKSIDKSRWVVMTKFPIPASKNRSYVIQQKVIADLADKLLIGYEAPRTLEAVTCIYSQYFCSSIRLFSNDPYSYTRCKEEDYPEATIVGGFGSDGLRVNKECYDANILGMAALKRF